MSPSPVGWRDRVYPPPSAFLTECKRKIRVHMGCEIKKRIVCLSVAS